MERIRFIIVLLLASFLALGLSQSVGAETDCDTNPGAVPFRATVDNGLLRKMLHILPPLEISYSESSLLSYQFNHIMHADMYTGIKLGGLDYLVTSDNGTLEAELYLPPWEAILEIEIEHPCIDCNARYADCREACAEGDTACLNTCSIQRQYCLNNWNNNVCWFESALIDGLFAGKIGASYGYITIAQTADTCVLPNCLAAYPYEDTEVIIKSLKIIALPPTNPFAPLVNRMVNYMANVLVPEAILQYFDSGEGAGLLLSAFHNDIIYDGCFPIPEVAACQSAGCSTLEQTRDNVRWSVNALLYGLPVAVMFGLLIMSRRKR